ncbi:MAG: hypothetical protein K6B75_00845 [Lachnospiraceae bacterium]|nr:hypothetical protein [Lachnospiraceae bacterium]
MRKESWTAVQNDNLSLKEIISYIPDHLYDYYEKTGLEEIKDSILKCSSGDKGCRETVMELIRMYLERIPEAERYNLLPCFNPDLLNPYFRFEILLYMKEKAEEGCGFLSLYDEYFSKNFFVEEVLEIGAEDINTIFKAENYLPEIEDLNAILSRIVFAQALGLGVIDSLNYEKGVEEIQIGMSGKNFSGYDYKNVLSGRETESGKCFEGVYLMCRGRLLKLNFLSFGSESEMKRVIRNLIADCGCGELTPVNPMIVTESCDGRRITVSCPPATEGYSALIRKFDVGSLICLEKLYPELRNAVEIRKLLGFIVKSGCHIAITGDMASGKTTLFRALLEQVPAGNSIRIIESESFELNARAYLQDRNILTMRVSKTTPVNEVLAFARKTTGRVFGIGEVNSPDVASLAVDLSKIAGQLIFSAHYQSTEEMVSDFVNAKLCVGGYSDERLALSDALGAVCFDIHLGITRGIRYPEYINEVVREPGGYRVKEIYKFDDKVFFVEKPSDKTMLKAKKIMKSEEYRGFTDFLTAGAKG